MIDVEIEDDDRRNETEPGQDRSFAATRHIRAAADGWPNDVRSDRKFERNAP
jgi:hypothetical protein